MIKNLLEKLSHYYLRMIEEISRYLANTTSLLFFDEVYYKAKYRRILHKKLNLKKPLGFSEKIQWLKLKDRNPLYTQLADKYGMREYVKQHVGEQYLNEIYGVFSTVDEINFEVLPDTFVLKATHGGGMNVICDDKQNLNVDEVKRKFRKWLNTNFYHEKGEWQYKNIEPKIICEKYLEGDDQKPIMDYKIYCFNGEPKFILVVAGRFTNQKQAIFNLNWELQPFLFDYPLPEIIIKKPEQLELMIMLAKRLSFGFDFCRVDMYSSRGKVFIGEITFHPASGYKKFVPSDYDLIFGNLLSLSK